MEKSRPVLRSHRHPGTARWSAPLLLPPSSIGRQDIAVILPSCRATDMPCSAEFSRHGAATPPRYASSHGHLDRDRFLRSSPTTDRSSVSGSAEKVHPTGNGDQELTSTLHAASYPSPEHDSRRNRTTAMRVGAQGGSLFDCHDPSISPIPSPPSLPTRLFR